MGKSVLPLLDELRIIGQNGLAYADNPYDEKRYERILELVAEYYGDLGDVSPTEVRGRFADRIGHVTPNVGSRAIIIDDEGRLLLMKRVDDGTWGLPGGYAEPGETPADTAVRETNEETGLSVRPTELISLDYRPPDEDNPHGFVGAAYLCTVTGGTLEVSHEGDALQYWYLEDVPDWHKDHERSAREAYEWWQEG